VGNRPIFLSPPPEFRLIKDPAFLALDAALYKVILYIAERFFLKKKSFLKNIKIKLLLNYMNNMSTQQQQTIKSIFNSDDDIRIEKTENGNEIYVFDPYNPLNKEIQHADIENILQTYGIKVPITNINLYRRAFINKSYLRRPELENQQNNIVIVPKPDNCMPLHTKSNERLEFVGDGVLELIAKWVLYLRFPKENEGFMTEKKIALVKNEAIGKLAFEMGLHKWVVLSKHAESKDIRTNLKKLGCVFEAFLGAIFLDYNRMEVKDEGHLFENLFLSGPGFQIAQIFVESVFEKHVDWMNLIRNDDNYKNILQVKIQKEFKITPEYMEVSAQNADTGYHMGVYLCLGQPVFGLTHQHSIPCSTFANFQEIHDYMSKHSKVFIFLGEGKHKIKKKAEQIACEFAIKIISQYNPDY
jgi:dsRNA-specific ribonuclease